MLDLKVFWEAQNNEEANYKQRERWQITTLSTIIEELKPWARQYTSQKWKNDFAQEKSEPLGMGGKGGVSQKTASEKPRDMKKEQMNRK